MSNKLLRELQSLRRWLDREPPPPIKEIINELDFQLEEARQVWLDEYIIWKEPKLPDDRTDSVPLLCRLCLASYESVRKTTTIEEFKHEFGQLDSIVIRINSRAQNFLSRGC